MTPTSKPDLTGRRVIILRGDFAGQEGLCLGTARGDLWSVSPTLSNRILELRVDSDFGILIKANQSAGAN